MLTKRIKASIKRRQLKDQTGSTECSALDSMWTLSYYFKHPDVIISDDGGDDDNDDGGDNDGDDHHHNVLTDRLESQSFPNNSAYFLIPTFLKLGSLGTYLSHDTSVPTYHHCTGFKMLKPEQTPGKHIPLRFQTSLAIDHHHHANSCENHSWNYTARDPVNSLLEAQMDSKRAQLWQDSSPG